MSIAGKYVIITRTVEQAQPFVHALERSYACPIVFPCINVVPTLSATYLHMLVQQLQAHQYDWIVVTSSNAIHTMHQQCVRHDVQWQIPPQVRIAAVGKQTAHTVQQLWHRTADIIPSEHRARALVSELQVFHPRHICWFTTPQAPNHFHDVPYHVDRVDVYKHEPIRHGTQFQQLLANQHVDIITWHSGSAVHAFIDRMLLINITRHHLRHVVFAAFGQSTYEACQHLGISPQVHTTEMTVPAWMDALHTYFNDYGELYGLPS